MAESWWSGVYALLHAACELHSERRDEDKLRSAWSVWCRPPVLTLQPISLNLANAAATPSLR